MSSKVTILNCNTRLDIPVDRILGAAAAMDFEEIMVLGVREDGTEVVSASFSHVGRAIYLLERTKIRLCGVTEDEQFVTETRGN